MNSNALVIAEAGVNHNGCEDLAMKLVDLAFSARADVVKFQIFDSDKLVTRDARKADYQFANTGNNESQHMMLKQLELSNDSHHRIFNYCNEIGIQYLSTAFDSTSLRFLAEDLDLTTFKISSGDLTNAPLLLEHAKYRRKMILSTGMSTLGEIEDALGVLAFGLLDNKEVPGRSAFEYAYSSNEGQVLLQKYVTLLHCTSEYPTSPQDINLNAMSTMSKAFGLDVGFSDHSIGNTAPIMAIAQGAKIVEKHFTLDKEMEGPDHKASMNPIELYEFVSAIKQAETCLGSGIKKPSSSELVNKKVARRSLVASREIHIGDTFSLGNVMVKRPGDGISPFLYWDLIGNMSSREYGEGELIIDSCIES